MPPRIREVDQAWVEALAASFDDHGMDTPIVVRPLDHDPVKDGAAVLAAYELVAGAHRLAAATLLGWSSIKAVVRHLDDDEARLVEIDENLMRRELHVLDRAIFLAERKRLYEARNPQTGHGGDRKGIKSQTLRLDLLPARFSADAAAKTGFSERAVQLAIQIATDLDDEAKRNIRSLPIADNQAALIALSREPPARQRTLSAKMRDGEATTVAAARGAAGFEAPSVPNPIMDKLAALHSAWGNAPPETRRLFLEDIGAVFTSAAAEQAAPAKPRRGVRQ